MTKDEIIRMAREANNGKVRVWEDCYLFYTDELERFSALVAAHEREKHERIKDHLSDAEEIIQRMMREREAEQIEPMNKNDRREWYKNVIDNTEQELKMNLDIQQDRKIKERNATVISEIDWINQSIKAAVLAEREACAKLVEPDEEHRRDASWGYIGGKEGVELLDSCAAAIRARNNHG